MATQTLNPLVFELGVDGSKINRKAMLRSPAT
jgi:hypothetical protein